MVFWLSLAVLLVGILGGLTYAALRGLQLWRTFKRTGKTIGAEVDRISEASTQIERHASAAADAAERLRESTGRLADSRARLGVQLAAVREAKGQVGRVFWLVPGL